MIPINSIGYDIVKTISQTYPKFQDEVSLNIIKNITVKVEFVSKGFNDDKGKCSNAEILVDGIDGSTNLKLIN